jgi:hypothetical protein
MRGTAINKKWRREFLRLVASAWQGLREWSGDAAYDTYVRCAVRQRAASLLSREEFYLEQLHKRYSRVSRCC